ncbi:MAG: hypothetical protein KDH19_05950 [Geminicoccaceae bacterium]|nr:hypothetical protein [Geminicoccaceae bacterium]
MNDRQKEIRRAFAALFLDEHGEPTETAKIVLQDLALAAFANRTTAHAEAFATATSEGRRQLLLHILARLRLEFAPAARRRAESDQPVVAITDEKDLSS